MPPKHRKIKLSSALENSETVCQFVRSYAARHIKDADAVTKLLVAVEEIFVNICRHAYGAGRGPVAVMVSWDSDFKVVLMDRGKPFNPLLQAAPNLALPAQKRRAGGLGIWMVREYMREVTYEHDGEYNILALVPQMPAAQTPHPGG